MESSQTMGLVSVVLVSDVSEAVCVSIIKGGCDWHCVHTLYLYTEAFICHSPDYVGNCGRSQMVSDVLSQHSQKHKMYKRT
jgi:hypothetical protein